MSAAESLADIVKHQAEIKQLDFLGFARQLGEQRQALGVFAGFKPFDLLDQLQGMLIHRVNVISVMQHHAKQPAELGNKRAENSGPMHFQQVSRKPTPSI